MNDHPPQLSVTISLHELYNVLCPNCRDALLDAMARKVGAHQVRLALQTQLEPGSPPPPSALAPDEHR